MKKEKGMSHGLCWPEGRSVAFGWQWCAALGPPAPGKRRSGSKDGPENLVVWGWAGAISTAVFLSVSSFCRR